MPGPAAGTSFPLTLSRWIIANPILQRTDWRLGAVTRPGNDETRVQTQISEPLLISLWDVTPRDHRVLLTLGANVSEQQERKSNWNVPFSEMCLHPSKCAPSLLPFLGGWKGSFQSFLQTSRHVDNSDKAETGFFLNYLDKSS